MGCYKPRKKAFHGWAGYLTWTSNKTGLSRAQTLRTATRKRLAGGAADHKNLVVPVRSKGAVPPKALPHSTPPAHSVVASRRDRPPAHNLGAPQILPGQQAIRRGGRHTRNLDDRATPSVLHSPGPRPALVRRAGPHTLASRRNPRKRALGPATPKHRNARTAVPPPSSEKPARNSGHSSSSTPSHPSSPERYVCSSSAF